MYKMKALLAALAVGVLSQPVIAQARISDPSATPGIDRRMENQDWRIRHGLYSGRLTHREAVRLDRRQDRIQYHVDRAKADGIVTARERYRLQHQLDRSSNGIWHQKHDRQHDYNHNGWNDRSYWR